MQHFTIRRGDRALRFPAPVGPIEDVAAVTAVAILGADWPGLRPHMEVEVGARVWTGQVLFTDRKHRAVRFVSPVAGSVESLTYGPRRTLDTLVIRVGAGGDPGAAAYEASGSDDLRVALLSGGFWPAFRARPFGSIPAPDTKPDAIVVNAVHAAPHSPDPVFVLDGAVDDFHKGCEGLTRLTGGNVYLCQSPGAPLGPEHDRIRHASFSGSVAAGLAGTQIDRLCPGRTVWSIAYQDVGAIGHFLATGRHRTTRVVSVTGPMAAKPRLLCVPLGARIADVIEEAAVVEVPGLSGVERGAAYLGRFDDQITLTRGPAARQGRRIRPRKPGISAAIASRALENSIAVDVLPIPLLRALSIGDAEKAERLGCLALVEEDLAAATRNSTSGIDYGGCLRRVLDNLLAEQK